MCCCLPYGVLDSDSANIKAVEPQPEAAGTANLNTDDLTAKKKRSLASQQTSSAVFLNPLDVAKRSDGASAAS